MVKKRENMKKVIVALLLLLCSFFIFGCADKNITSDTFYPYQKIIQLEKLSDAPDPYFSEQIKRQLIDIYGISEMTSERLIMESKFERCRVEYAASQEYEQEEYPFFFKAEFIIWKSEKFFAICNIYDKKMDTYDEQIKVVAEGPVEPWIDDFTPLKVLPIEQAVELTMGGRVSFTVKGKDNVGPFTLVKTFYISCPSF